MSVPVYICCRDRLTCLRQLVAWLEHAGHVRITFLDNDSAWKPLLDYYATTPHTVVRLGANLGSKALWEAGLVPDEPYVYTDPDVVPTDECPLDVVDYLGAVLRATGLPKVGLGLRIDAPLIDAESLEVETRWRDPTREQWPGLFVSPVDTTFALYPAGSEFHYAEVRTATPCELRHLPWYDPPDDEDRFYASRASIDDHGSRWARQARAEKRER